MVHQRELLYRWYLTLLSAALTIGIAITVDQIFGLYTHIIFAVALPVLLTLVLFLFERNRKNIISYIIITCILIFLFLLIGINKFNVITWFEEFLYWCQIYNGSEELYHAKYAYSVVVLVSFVGSMVCYLLLKIIYLRVMVGFFVFTGLLLLSLQGHNPTKPVVAILLFYIITVVVELYGVIHSKRNQVKEKREGLLYLLPVFAALVFLSVVFPSKTEPMEFKAIKHLYGNLRSSIDTLVQRIDIAWNNKSTEFSIAYTGYSDESKELGDTELNTDPSIVLRVNGDRGQASTYLIGSIRDVYTGNRWEKSREDKIDGEEEYFLDMAEFFYALSRQDQEVLSEQKYAEHRRLSIEYLDITTRTFFHPLKMDWFQVNGEDQPSVEYGDMNFEKAQGEGTKYHSVYYEMNLEGEHFKEMLRKENEFSYKNPMPLKETIGTKHNLLEVLSQRAKMNQKVYTRLPDTIPSRVYQLAEDITAPYNNNYDKLKAIELYLLNNYKYTLRPDSIPKEEDFVDYFLFQQQEGYCTYFASAMAILSRCIGIPTRYVEGFVLNYEDQVGYNTYVIRNNNAHAWVEAYFEGVGWIPFEATPSFRQNRYVEWKKPEKKSGGTVSYGDWYLEKRAEETMAPIIDQHTTEEENEKESNFLFIKRVLIGILIASAFVSVFVIYERMLQFHYRRIYKKADLNKKFYLVFLEILRRLKIEGYTLEDQETMKSMMSRIGTKASYGGISFIKIGNLYMDYRYGDAQISEEELSTVLAFQNGLKEKQLAERGRLRIYLEDFWYLAIKGITN